MKVLADTCAWSLLLRRKKNSISKDEQLLVRSLTDAIHHGQVVIIGHIRQEVLSGIKHKAQFDQLRAALQAFPDENLTTHDYEEAARLFNICRSQGVECGSTDILICAVAVQRRYAILTNDGGIKRCIDVLKAEPLMH